MDNTEIKCEVCTNALQVGFYVTAVIVLVVSVFMTNPAVAEEGNHDEMEEIEEILVQATRSRRRVQDQPTRIEVLDQEEISEKIMMRPGNISMMLAETGGLRVQVTAPALGSSNIRIHGMRGRYTQLLADGLPLYGGQASGLGLLQVPPSDLGQIEVIKGSASALYGGQALGGVINLVSKRPSEETEGEVILNATTRDGQDFSTYASTPLGNRWSGSLLLAANHHSAKDLDNDGWIDLPEYERWSVRPRLFWDGSEGTNLYLTVGAMGEDRKGGTLGGSVVPDGNPFPQHQDTDRLDGGFVLQHPINDQLSAQVRASAVLQQHDHVFGNLLEEDRHQTILTEASLSGDLPSASWVGGVAFQSDEYDSDTFSIHDYTYESPAAFAHFDQDFGERLSGALSFRWDDHSEYGGELSPRMALLFREGAWTVRGSWGRGFFAPTPFLEETEAAGLSRLEPLANLKAETAETASIDVSYSAGNLETGLTFFGSNIDDAVRLETLAADRVQMVNVEGVTRTRGIEALMRWRLDSFVVTASYLYTDASEPDEGDVGRRSVPLTPRHSAGLVAIWEVEEKGRIGFEVYYTGTQSLEDNPYRFESDPYFEVGLLGEIIRGRYSFFLNLENLLNVRQTREDVLVRPNRTPDGRWTVDAWASLEGFVANAGIRIQLGE
ncbi:MAG: TonB-dependent receptor plug domain-containing protein [bacterium]